MSIEARLRKLEQDHPVKQPVPCEDCTVIYNQGVLHLSAEEALKCWNQINKCRICNDPANFPPQITTPDTPVTQEEALKVWQEMKDFCDARS